MRRRNPKNPVKKMARRERIGAPEIKKTAIPEEMITIAVPRSGSSIMSSKTREELRKKGRKFFFLERRVDK